MVVNALSDTQVELLAGAAIVDSEEPSSGTSVTIIYRNWRMRFPQKGVYRIDSEPPRLWVSQGLAEVVAVANGVPVSVEQGMELPFAAVLVPERPTGETGDPLSRWAEGRSDSISADNSIAAQITDDPTAVTGIPGIDSGIEGLTYFPLLGLPPAGLGLSAPYSSAYNSYTPYQPGFNSIYLPGYTYRPFFLAFPMGRFGSSLYSTPRIGTMPGVGMPGMPHSPLRIPLPRPMPGHPIGHGGMHVGGHVGGHR